MEVAREAEIHTCLNPNAQEFHPFLPYYNYHHSNFLSPLHPAAPPVLRPHQHFHPNYPIYPYPVSNTFLQPDLHHDHQHHYYLKSFHLKNPPTPPLLPLLPLPTAHRGNPKPAARPKQKPTNGPSCSSMNKTSCTAKVWVEKGEEKKTRGGRERKRKMKVMPVKPHGVETTVMIRNIPNQYTRLMLMNFLDKFCNEENQRVMIKDCSESGGCHADFPLVSAAYDFLYLPIDFKTGANKGYAFVNFCHPIGVRKLHRAYNNKGWKHCSSSKICQIAYAAIQGKEKLRQHFGRSRFMCNNDEYLPVCFNPPRDGSASQQVTQTTVGELIKPSSSPRI